MNKQYKADQCIKIDTDLVAKVTATGRAYDWEVAAAYAIQSWGYASQDRIIDEIEKHVRLYVDPTRRSSQSSYRQSAYRAFRWWITHLVALHELGHVEAQPRESAFKVDYIRGNPPYSGRTPDLHRQFSKAAQ